MHLQTQKAKQQQKQTHTHTHTLKQAHINIDLHAGTSNTWHVAVKQDQQQQKTHTDTQTNSHKHGFFCRYEQYVARGGQAGPAAAEAPAAAVRGALRYVQHFNAHALLSGAQAAVAEAWMQLTQVCGCSCTLLTCKPILVPHSCASCYTSSQSHTSIKQAL